VEKKGALLKESSGRTGFKKEKRKDEETSEK